ncbi:MAG TPA: hypothetical protein VN794_14230 [Methylomirabilota bacterium]|jgi:hypothetical protein|nr:hypothetical protein [Methylomirabilota bacterium]
MRTLFLVTVTILGSALVADRGWAQVTNPCVPVPATKLESFETNANVIILKTSTAIGSLAGNTGNLGIKCREVTDVSTGRKEQGLAIEVAQHGDLLIDYDEIPSLINAVDYLSKLDMSATKLNFLDASYTTKGGFRIAALASRRNGVLQFAVRDARSTLAPVVFSRDQMPQFSGLINLAKKTLDSARE